MSLRRDMTERMETFLNDVGLNEVYGVMANYEGKIKTLSFCKARSLDGQISIYGLNFIQVKYKTAIRALPQEDSRIFESEKNTMDFLKAAFVDYDYELAESIPYRSS